MQPGGPGWEQLASSEVLTDWVFLITVNSVFLSCKPWVSRGWIHLTFRQVKSLLLEYRNSSSSLLPALPTCVIVYLMCFFNATLKDSPRLAQPLREVSDSCICLFYIKLSNVLYMFFSVRNGGREGNLHINSPSSTMCYFFNYYFLSSLWSCPGTLKSMFLCVEITSK